jgi:site-specific recombinase XerC
LLRFKEKGGKEKELPVHHKLEELLDEYLKATGLGVEPGSPFPVALGKTGKLSRRPLVRTDAADMLKRRLKQVGLPAHYSPHSFRATGITNFLENDGTLEAAQRIAGHADSRTTKLYDPPRPEGFARGYGENSVLANPGHGEKVGDHVQQTFKYSCDIRSQLILTSQVTSVQRMSNY